MALLYFAPRWPPGWSGPRRPMASPRRAWVPIACASGVPPPCTTCTTTSRSSRGTGDGAAPPSRDTYGRVGRLPRASRRAWPQMPPPCMSDECGGAASRPRVQSPGGSGAAPYDRKYERALAERRARVAEAEGLFFCRGKCVNCLSIQSADRKREEGSTATAG